MGDASFWNNPDREKLIQEMKRLKAQKEPVRILTFFGSWCPHCSAHVPLLLKVEQGHKTNNRRYYRQDSHQTDPFINEIINITWCGHNYHPSQRGRIHRTLAPEKS
jgi:thiol-disulfide isomerase/thioredoxin